MSTQAPRMMQISLPDSQVCITFETPVASQRMLLGKTPAEVVRLVGILHNLCSEAHRAAARAATGLAGTGSAATAQSVMFEILREHLVVLCRSAPPLMGLEPVALPIAFSRLTPDTFPRQGADTFPRQGADTFPRQGADLAPGGETMRERVSRALFGSEPGAFFSWQGVGADSCLAPFFAALAQREAALGLDAEVALPCDPTFFARIAQDTAFVRPARCGPLQARMLGRLYEVHKILTALGTDAEAEYLPQMLADGGARIPAARGMLVHRATLAGEIIAAYSIETPTAAMLDADGPLAVFLAALAAAPGADEALLRLGLLAFDPCVPHGVSVNAPPDRMPAHA